MIGSPKNTDLPIIEVSFDSLEEEKRKLQREIYVTRQNEILKGVENLLFNNGFPSET